MGKFRGITTDRHQNAIIDYVGKVLSGEKARSHGSSMKITDLSGSLHERAMLGGVFIAAILHFAADWPAPTTDLRASKEMWRKGFELYHTMNDLRVDGRFPAETEAKLLEYGPGDDVRLQAGHALLRGLELRNLNAQYVAKDAYLTMVYLLESQNPMLNT